MPQSRRDYLSVSFVKWDELGVLRRVKTVFYFAYDSFVERLCNLWRVLRCGRCAGEVSVEPAVPTSVEYNEDSGTALEGDRRAVVKFLEIFDEYPVEPIIPISVKCTRACYHYRSASMISAKYIKPR
jgi:hypothetical protein